jgi:hypothetical protein
VDHTRIQLVVWVHLIGQRSIRGIKHGIFLWIPPFNCYNMKCKGLFMLKFPLEYLISHVSRSYG